MKSRKYSKNLYLCLVLLLLALAVGISGCDQDRLRFMPRPSRAVLAVSADDIVQLMSRAGFSNEQIIEFGPGLRSALLNSGACQVQQGETIQAIFAVQNHYVHVSTKMRGSFIYNTEKNGLEGEFRSAKPEAKIRQTSPADGSGAPSPLLQTTPTGNAAPKLQFFNGG